jgi:hypothetical protein
MNFSLIFMRTPTFMNPELIVPQLNIFSTLYRSHCFYHNSGYLQKLFGIDFRF